MPKKFQAISQLKHPTLVLTKNELILMSKVQKALWDVLTIQGGTMYESALSVASHP